MLDVRLPIGGLFFILGILIAGWGYANPIVPAIAAKSGPLPINWDILWGILMTLFGVAMYSLARLDHALGLEKQVKEEKEKAAEAGGSEAGVQDSAAAAPSETASTTSSESNQEASAESGNGSSGDKPAEK